VLATFALICLFPAHPSKARQRADQKSLRNAPWPPTSLLKMRTARALSFPTIAAKWCCLISGNLVWTMWCRNPWFTDFEQKYKSQGFACWVSQWTKMVGCRQALRGRAKDQLSNSHGYRQFGQLYGGLDSLPTSFLIDRDGKVAFPPHIGLISKNEYLNEIQCLLGDQPANSMPVESASSGASAACQQNKISIAPADRSW